MRTLAALTSVIAGLLFVLMASGCGNDNRQGSAQSERATNASAKDFDRGRFDRPTDIDNKWLPLEPGTQFVYEGSSIVDGRRERHRDVFTVTDLTKVVDGVRTLVTWDRDYSAGRLQETELAFSAQDNDGNVWHLGEYPEEYEHGKVVDAPAWLGGLKGASPGIEMRAEPRPGASSYAQGYAPAPINWADRARTYRTGQMTRVPAGRYEHVLVTEEFERDKPHAFQLKYYAPGMGLVRVGWRGSREEERERLVLVNVAHLDNRALAGVRQAALAQERRAYRLSKDVYGQTPPARPLGVP
jgi:hypothetical protein